MGWKIPSKYFLLAAAVRHGPLSFKMFCTKGEELFVKRRYITTPSIERQVL